MKLITILPMCSLYSYIWLCPEDIFCLSFDRFMASSASFFFSSFALCCCINSTVLWHLCVVTILYSICLDVYVLPHVHLKIYILYQPFFSQRVFKQFNTVSREKFFSVWITLSLSHCCLGRVCLYRDLQMILLDLPCWLAGFHL